jgi:hypothetical protein
MARNDYPNGQTHTPFKKRPAADMLADFSSCFRLVDKENGLSSAEKRGEEGSLESEKPGYPFGTPNSIVEKINQFSPRRTTCEKRPELADSPHYVWKVKSSGKKFQRLGQTPNSIFQNSNEKTPNFLDFQPPSDIKPPQMQPEKPDFVLPELDRQSFNLNLFDSPWGIKQLAVQEYTAQYGVQFSSQNGESGETEILGSGVPAREARGRAEPGKCNCRNSQCLKMYCDCLKRGEYCVGCNCVGCENHADSHIRRKKVGSLFEKNRKSAGGMVVASAEDLKAKVARNGCNCRKNACLKKYCECHQFGLRCSKACRCLTCQNGRDDPTD